MALASRRGPRIETTTANSRIRTTTAPRRTFPAVEQAEIDAAIAAVGGSAFVKLNWSAPKDAAWLGSLECATAGDAFALLAASSLVKDDAARAGEVVVLAVRRFVSVEPSREFRCFVLDGRLVAACQRRVDTVFRDLSDEATVSEMRARLRAFFDRALSLPTHCVVDVVIERRSTLVDVNVAAQRTDPLLFEWGDVLALRRSERLGRGRPRNLRAAGRRGPDAGARRLCRRSARRSTSRRSRTRAAWMSSRPPEPPRRPSSSSSASSSSYGVWIKLSE